MKRAGYVVLLTLAILSTSAGSAFALSRSSMSRVLSGLAVQEENNSLRHIHTKWFQTNYSYSTVAISSITEASGTVGATGTIEVLQPPKGFSAKSVDEGGAFRPGGIVSAMAVGPRPGSTMEQAQASYATALALSNGTYSAGRVGVSNAEALRRVVAWNNGLALSHVRGQWGGSWQSALWTYYLGASSKKVWSSLPTCTQEFVTASVAAEANRLLAIDPPYYRNASGKIVSPGDSKSEENAWNASLLFLAARMYADGDPALAARWEAWARRYALTAYATPDQVHATSRIHGSNLNPNGTVVNHHIIHPDYMATAGEMKGKYLLVAFWTGTPEAWEGSNRFSRVWQGLTQVKFSGKSVRKPGGTIYRVGKHGAATADVFYPQGTDWSQKRRENFALMDVSMFAAGHNYAYPWAKAHISYVLAQQARHADGSVYSSGETRAVGEEQFAAASAAEMVELLKTVH